MRFASNLKFINCNFRGIYFKKNHVKLKHVNEIKYCYKNNYIINLSGF